MNQTIRRWLTQKWVLGIDPKLAQAYQVTFSTLDGQQVLQHLVDTLYCQVCESMDPIALASHNARRSVVHEILTNIDLGQHADKYQLTMDGVNHG